MTERQLSDGRWPGDKWNGSWLYTTWRVIVALSDFQEREPLARAEAALVAHQRPDGGWGSFASNPEETAYGIHAMRQLHRMGWLSPMGYAALRQAEQWLFNAYRPFALNPQACWLAKEPYRPQRIARTIELAALLSSLDSMN